MFDDGIVLSLCDYTGNMVKPWADEGWECWIVDNTFFAESFKDNIRRIPEDAFNFDFPGGVYIAFAFPPCTHFSQSGARWWDEKDKDYGMISESLALVQHCYDLISQADSFMLENPTGRLNKYWKPYTYSFNPCEYGGYLNPPGDAYTKRTCLWTGGNFIMPPIKPVPVDNDLKIRDISESEDRAHIRSITPMGFAQAVFEHNRIPI